MGTCEELLPAPREASSPSLDLGLTSPTKEKIITHDHVDPFTDDPLDQSLVEDLQSLNLVSDNYGPEATEQLQGVGYSDQHPLRPYAEDCPFYVKTGWCKFGPICKFNHPLRRAYLGNQGSNLLEPSNRIECKYYLTAEGCKYGKDCRYSHSKENLESALPQEREMSGEWLMAKPEQVECKFYLTPRGCMYGDTCKYAHTKGYTEHAELNFLGLPIRPQEKDCPYYMRSGSCKYGVYCKFHHPDPAAAKQSGALDSTSGPVLDMGAPWNNADGGYPASHSSLSLQDQASWSSEMTSKKVDPDFKSRSSFGSVAPSVHVHTELKPQWSLFQGPTYPQDDGSVSSSSLRNNQIRSDVRNYSEQIQGEEFPERPGQPVCNHYMNTGNCKYKSSCRYHHPKDRTSEVPFSALSSKGLPLRPDKRICRHYEQYGVCKYGSSCLFNHPESPFSSFHVDLLPETVPVSNSVGSSWE